MDVEDPIASAYLLEISSPGLDRPLFHLDHYLPYIGKMISVRSKLAVMGRRKFKGILREASAEQVSVEVDGEIYEIPLSSIDKANLVVEL
jgi:ribosome maturation factor RimP